MILQPACFIIKRPVDFLSGQSMIQDYQIAVTVNGGTHIFPIEIERKKRKQLVLRVYHKTKRVLFSMPFNTPDDYARQFLQSRRNWLEEQITNILLLPPEHEYQSGEIFYRLGDKITLSSQPGALNRAEFTDGSLLLHYKEPLDKTVCRKALDKLFTELARVTIEQSMARMLAIYAPFIPIAQPPAYKLRKMTSRWGVCWPRRRQICFSTRLAHIAPELIDYVVAHELCHLKFCDHGPCFWRLLQQGLPDWQNYCRKLAKINTSIDI